MADMMQFDLVSPERRLASFEAVSVRVPAAEGEMTVMAGHAPVISTLRPGILHVEGGQGGEYIVTGGFVDISEAGVSVLAERAYAKDSATKDDLQSVLDAAHEHHANVAEEHKDAAALLVADLTELLEAMV